jgi:sugar phosphate isomerase/epimerase
MSLLDPKLLAVVAAALDPDVRTASRLSRQFGFAGLLLDAAMPGLNLTDLSQSGRREIRQLLQSENQRLAAIRLDLGPNGITPRTDLDKLLSRLDKTLDAAASLGSTVVCLDAGPLPPPHETSAPPKAVPEPTTAGRILLPSFDDLQSLVGVAAPPAAQSLQPDAAQVAAVDTAIEEFARRADRFSITIAVSSELSSFASIQRIVSRYDARQLGLDLDSVAVIRDRWTLDQILSALGPRIVHVRLRDAAVGADRRTAHVPLGRGSVPIAALIASLTEGGYPGMFTVDTMEFPDRHAAAAAARRFLVGSK